MPIRPDDRGHHAETRARTRAAELAAAMAPLFDHDVKKGVPDA